MAYRVPEDKPMSPTERAYLPELVRGVLLVARHWIKNIFLHRDPNPDVLNRKGSDVSTVMYPEEPVPYPPGYRGLHRLVPREDGRPRCVACYMCATVCPAQCIYIEAGEYPVDDKASENAVIEKYPVKFVIDELRCVVCGFCVEACPKDAIRMDTFTHTPSGDNRSSFIWDIDGAMADQMRQAGAEFHTQRGLDRDLRPALLKGPAVSHPSDPWFKRPSSKQPADVHKEAHTRVGMGHDHSAAHKG